ncbi:hypothetical protein MRX96_055989 [Rhipicephalus microplus]
MEPLGVAASAKRGGVPTERVPDPDHEVEQKNAPLVVGVLRAGTGAKTKTPPGTRVRSILKHRVYDTASSFSSVRPVSRNVFFVRATKHQCTHLERSGVIEFGESAIASYATHNPIYHCALR